VGLYDAVAQLAPSPVIELNRAVAVGMAFGPAAGLDLWTCFSMSRRSSRITYCGCPRRPLDEARRFERHVRNSKRAGSLTENMRERELMQRRAAECAARDMAG